MQNDEVLFVIVGTALATYFLYKYHKKMANRKLNEAYYQPDQLWTGNKAIGKLH